MDSTFKRVPARRQLKEVSEKLSNLERSLGVAGNASSRSPGSTASPQSSGSSSQQFRSMPRLFTDVAVNNLTLTKQRKSVDSSSPYAESMTPQGWLHLQDIQEQDSWNIANITLGTPEVVHWFQVFESIYYRFVPFLERVTSLKTLHEQSPLLFWTIILISMRGRNDTNDVREALGQIHKNLLLSKILEIPVQLKTLHAVLIVVSWPYFVTHQLEDISFSLVNNAVSMGMLIGLHEPGNERDFYSVLKRRVVIDPHIRCATWLACFNLSCV
jgi:hypothetical protein